MPVPRTFKPYSCTTVAQPLIATTFSNGIAGSEIGQTVIVPDSSMFLNSDTVNCMPTTGGTPWSYPPQPTARVVRSVTMPALRGGTALRLFGG